MSKPVLGGKMSSSDLDLTEYAYDFPELPKDEVERETLVNQLINGFNNSAIQIVLGQQQSGKTTLLGQFCKQNKERAISYFITSNPRSQRLYNFYYSICTQIKVILGETPLPTQISFDDLRNLFDSLYFNLKRLSKRDKEKYFFVIDGIEWSFEGVIGERIIDIFPLSSTNLGAYTLFSCRSDKKNGLPQWENCVQSEIMPFNKNETHGFLSQLSIPPEKILTIYKRSAGNPGVLRVIKSIWTSGNFNLDSDEYSYGIEQLIGQYIKIISSKLDRNTIESLQFLSISSVAISCKLLSELVGESESELRKSLENTDLVKSKSDSDLTLFEYKTEVIKEVLAKQTGTKRHQYTKKLADTAKKHPEYCDDFTLVMLLRDAEDYEGIRNQLTTSSIITKVRTAKDLAGVIKILHLAVDMAKKNKDLNWILRGTSAMITLKTTLSHMVGTGEIDALLAIGEFSEAISKAYASPELSSRIILLAKSYSAMKESRERVSQEAIHEIENMISQLHIADMEKDQIINMALEVFPILPDVSVSMLERTEISPDQKDIIDIATAIRMMKSTKRPDETTISEISDPKLVVC